MLMRNLPFAPVRHVKARLKLPMVKPSGRHAVRGALGYIGDASDGTGDSTVNSIVDSIGKVAAAYNSQQILDVNLQRAAQNLPPIDQSAYAPQVSVGLDANTKSLLIMGGLVLAGVFLLKR